MKWNASTFGILFASLAICAMGCSGSKRKASAASCALDETDQEGTCVKTEIGSDPGTLTGGGIQTAGSQSDSLFPVDEQSGSDFDSGPSSTATPTPSPSSFGPQTGTNQPVQPAQPNPWLGGQQWNQGQSIWSQQPIQGSQWQNQNQWQTQNNNNNINNNNVNNINQQQQQIQQFPTSTPINANLQGAPVSQQGGPPHVSLILYQAAGNFQAYAAFSHTQQLGEVELSYHGDQLRYAKQVKSDGSLLLSGMELLVSMKFRLADQICSFGPVAVSPVAKTHRPTCRKS